MILRPTTTPAGKEQWTLRYTGYPGRMRIGCGVHVDTASIAQWMLNLQAALNLNIGLYRMDLVWSSIELSQGVYTWGDAGHVDMQNTVILLDYLFSNQSTLDVEPCIVAPVNTLAGLTPVRQTPAFYTELNANNSTTNIAYANFIIAMRSRFPKMKRISLVNEPDVNGYSNANHLAMFRQVVPIIKAACPDLIITGPVSTGYSSTHSTNFAQQVDVANLIGQWDFHNYIGGNTEGAQAGAEDQIGQGVERWHEQYKSWDSSFVNKTAYLSETGFTDTATGATVGDMARYLLSLSTVPLYSHVSIYNQYNDTPTWGLMSSYPGNAPKARGLAFQEVVPHIHFANTRKRYTLARQTSYLNGNPLSVTTAVLLDSGTTQRLAIWDKSRNSTHTINVTYYGSGTGTLTQKIVQGATSTNNLTYGDNAITVNATSTPVILSCADGIINFPQFQ